MSIIGIGVDICENKRIEKLIHKFKDHFLQRIYHESEISYGLNEYKNNSMMLNNFFAKRFAGKEALIKAIGLSQNIKKNEIAILPDMHGKPVIKFFGKTQEAIQHLFPYEVAFHISLSDEKEFSIANVIFERL